MRCDCGKIKPLIMRCDCGKIKPLIMKMGNWGIPFWICRECGDAVRSEICRILERGSNHHLKSLDEYLAFCDKCEELRV